MSERISASPSLRCPACGPGRLLLPAGRNGAARCASCRALYRVVEGVADLWGAGTEPRRPAQILMEWGPVIRIYESRWWRRSPLFVLYTGLSFDREFDLVAEAAGLSAGSCLLDLACGSGIYGRSLAGRLPAGWVVGLDRSAPMLRAFRRRADAQGLSRLTLVRASALRLPFEDRLFHSVVCCGALHLFPDPAKVLAEVRRVLRPGGSFAASVLGTPSGSRVRALVERHAGRMGLRSFRPDGLRSLLREAGFGRVDLLHQGASGGWLVVSASP